jgi:hypothetical protein
VVAAPPRRAAIRDLVEGTLQVRFGGKVRSIRRNDD